MPIIEQAEEYLTEASNLNPGPWIEHSRKVAFAAKLFAERCSELDSETAYI